jgi:asparagine synthase (glutamine-hydrolysing)
VSNYFKTEHVTERCTLGEMLDRHGEILSRLDEPLADASFIPTFMLCKLARKHVTVALSGDGGDELFMGYPTFFAHQMAAHFRRFPASFLKLCRGLVNRLPTSMANLSFDFRLKQFFKGIGYDDLVRDQVWLGAFSDTELRTLLVPGLAPEAAACYGPVEDFLKEVSGQGLERLQEFYFNFYLQGDILVKVDRASMANSLEVRSPLLDDAFVGNMLGIPPGLKVKAGQGKYIFKKAMEGRLPKKIIYRKKKGFGIPVARWIRQDLKSEFERVLSPAELRKDGLFNTVQVQSILNEHLSGQVDHRKKLWTLYVFQKWKRTFLD